MCRIRGLFLAVSSHLARGAKDIHSNPQLATKHLPGITLWHDAWRGGDGGECPRGSRCRGENEREMPSSHKGRRRRRQRPHSLPLCMRRLFCSPLSRSLSFPFVSRLSDTCMRGMGTLPVPGFTTTGSDSVIKLILYF